MAPTRRRSEEGSPDDADQEVPDRSPKRHQLDGAVHSNGSHQPTGNAKGRVDCGDEDMEQSAIGGGGKGRMANVASSNGGGSSSSGNAQGNGDDDDADLTNKMEQTEAMVKEVVGDDNEENGDDDRGDGEDPVPRQGGKKRKGKRNGTEGDGPDPGIVLVVKVENFMCHRKLTVPLGPSVNFINGRNGSGKSAILAAIQICLGARANSTHRAKKLTDFIRHGHKGEAVLEVTLLNNEQGYKFEEYGKSITVRRTIKQPSGGGFALLDSEGNVKSKEKAELARMLDHLDIQVDNPCAVLDQENFKKFLQRSEGDKYKFFMRATDLDRIFQHSNEVKPRIDKMTEGYTEAVEQLPRYKQIVTGLSAELKEFDRIKNMDKKIYHMKEQLCWSHVAVAEDNVEERTYLLKQKKLQINAYQGQIAECDAQLEELSSSNNASSERVVEAEVKRLKVELVQAHNNLKNANAHLSELAAQQENLRQEVQSREVAKKKAERAVREATAKAMENASGDREKTLLADIEKVEQNLSNIEEIKNSNYSDDVKDRLQEAIAPANEAFETAEQVYKERQSDYREQQEYVQSISGAMQHHLCALGSYMPELVDTIQKNASKFRSLPVGPIGAYVQLKEEHKAFAIPVEIVVKKCLNNFVVTCQQDKTTLLQLMKSMKFNRELPPAIIMQPKGPRHSRPEAPPGYLQVMQAIHVTDDQVRLKAFNALVGQLSIEKEGLFMSKEEAEQKCLVGTSGSYQRMPHHLRGALYPSGYGNCSRFSVVDGNVQTRMNLVNHSDNRRVLAVGQGTRLQEAQQCLLYLQGLLDTAHDNADAAKRLANSTTTRFEEVRERVRKLQQQKLEMADRLDKLRRDLLKVQHAANEKDPTQGLERIVNELREEIESLTQELAVVEGQMVETSSQVKPFEAARRAASKARQDAVKKQERVREQRAEAEERERTVSNRRAELVSGVKKFETEAAAFEKQRSEAEDSLADTLAKAEGYVRNLCRAQENEWDGRRNTSKYTAEVLENKIRALSAKKAKEVEKQNLSAKAKEEVQVLLARATEAFREKVDLVRKLKEDIQLLQREHKARVLKWIGMKRYIQRKTTVLFNTYLQKKGAAGEVRFDDKNKLLGLTYQKLADDDSTQCTDIKLLSGGERSYSTLALLLALGSVHECPFRVMDEFDVFMDAMSRNIAIKAVIEFAAESDRKQFIFITPQDLSSVTVSDDIKIFKMKPPGKANHNQITLEEAFGNAS